MFKPTSTGCKKSNILSTCDKLLAHVEATRVAVLQLQYALKNVPGETFDATASLGAVTESKLWESADKENIFSPQADSIDALQVPEEWQLSQVQQQLGLAVGNIVQSEAEKFSPPSLPDVVRDVAEKVVQELERIEAAVGTDDGQTEAVDTAAAHGPIRGEEQQPSTNDPSVGGGADDDDAPDRD